MTCSSRYRLSLSWLVTGQARMSLLKSCKFYKAIKRPFRLDSVVGLLSHFFPPLHLTIGRLFICIFYCNLIILFSSLNVALEQLWTGSAQSRIRSFLVHLPPLFSERALLVLWPHTVLTGLCTVLIIALAWPISALILAVAHGTVTVTHQTRSSGPPQRDNFIFVYECKSTVVPPPHTCQRLA